MEESILNSVKKLIGIDAEDTAFDADIILHINTVLILLHQLGVGSAEVFQIEDDEPTWGDFLGEFTDVAGCKTYTGLKVRMIFDPPSSATVAEAINKTLAELEWRLIHQVEIQRELA